jgi:hypothetical protein
MKKLTLIVLLLPSVAFAQMARKVQETSQRGSGPKGAATATPGPGIESGTGNAIAGGRTDVGPTGVTGLENGMGPAHERALAKANDQARGENEKGSFLRPAETPAQLELNPQVMGSGAEEGAFPLGGRNYLDNAHAVHDNAHAVHGRADGVASGAGNPGGAAALGSSGKSERTQER